MRNTSVSVKSNQAEAITCASPRQRSPDHNARGDLNKTVINRIDKLYNHGCCWPWSMRRYGALQPWRWKRGSHACTRTHTRTREGKSPAFKKIKKKLPPAEVGSSPSAAVKETEKREETELKRVLSLTQSRRFAFNINCAACLHCARKHFLRVIRLKSTERREREARRTRCYSQHPAGGKTPGCCGEAEPGAVSHPLLRPSLPAGFWTKAFDYYAQVVQD